MKADKTTLEAFAAFTTAIEKLDETIKTEAVTEIQRLIEAVNRLSEISPSTGPHVVGTKEVAPEVSLEQLREVVLPFVRSSDKNKVRGIAILKIYGAGTLGELDAEGRKAVFAEIERASK